MEDSDGLQPVQHVHEANGREMKRCVYCETDETVPREPSIADCVPVTEIMTRDMTCACPDVGIDELVKLMIDHHIGCLPVVEAPGRPVGMVTKLDLVEQCLGTRGDAPRTAGELMMPFTLTLREHATVAHAATMMAVEDIHHVPIVNSGGLMVGIVSSMDIVRWLVRNDGLGKP